MANYIPVNIINANGQSFCLEGVNCPVYEVINYTPFIVTFLVVTVVGYFFIKKWKEKINSNFIQS